MFYVAYHFDHCLQDLSSLEYLDISQNENVFNKHFARLLNSTPKLNSLTVGNCITSKQKNVEFVQAFSDFTVGYRIKVYFDVCVN